MSFGRVVSISVSNSLFYLHFLQGKTIAKSMFFIKTCCCVCVSVRGCVANFEPATCVVNFSLWPTTFTSHKNEMRLFTRSTVQLLYMKFP